VCYASHGASIARAVHEPPPTSAPGTAHAGPSHPRRLASGMSRARAGMSRAWAEWRMVQGVHGKAWYVASGMLVARRIPYRSGGQCPPDLSRPGLPRCTQQLHCSSRAGPREARWGVPDGRPGFARGPGQQNDRLASTVGCSPDLESTRVKAAGGCHTPLQRSISRMQHDLHRRNVQSADSPAEPACGSRAQRLPRHAHVPMTGRAGHTRLGARPSVGGGRCPEI
jgi:hypothetical protein